MLTVDAAFLKTNGWSESAAAHYERVVAIDIAERLRVVLMLVMTGVAILGLVRVVRLIRFARWWVISAAAALLLLSGAAACHTQTRDDWTTATPAGVELDSALLERLHRDAVKGAFPNIHSVLLVRRGRLAMEEYYNGFDRETRQYTASVSKSVGSILLGIAIDRGLVPGIDERGVDTPLTDLLPAYEGKLSDPDRRDLTLRHVLTMSAGLEWDETSYPYSDSRNDWVQASRSDDPVGFVLGRRLVTEPGRTFNYNGGLTITLAYLVEKGAGMRADRFAERHLFSPLGITDYEWERLPNGMTDTDGGLHLRPRDMAKLGQLYLNGGTWRGTSVVSESWVRESVREQIITEGQPNYGFQWWCGDFQYADRSAFAFFASGHGGQKIYGFPDLDLVVVLTHAVFDNPMGELHNGAILARYVLPAADPGVDWGDPITLDSTALTAYAGEYETAHDRFIIVIREGSLWAESAGSPSLELVPLSQTRFRGTLLGLIDVELDFDLDDGGRASGARARFMFNDRNYRRMENR